MSASCVPPPTRAPVCGEAASAGSQALCSIWGALVHLWRPEIIADGCGISCSPIGQEISSFHTINMWACQVASVVFTSFVTPWTVAHQAPLSIGISRQEYWRGWPCPPPGDLLDPEIKPRSPVAPASQADSLPQVPPGQPQHVRALSISLQKLPLKENKRWVSSEQEVFTTDHTGHLHLLCPPLKPRKWSIYCWEGTSYFSHLTEFSPYLSLNSYLGDNGKAIEYFSQCQNVRVTKQTLPTEWLVTDRWFISFLTLRMSSLLWQTVEEDASLYFNVTLVEREEHESESHAKLFEIQASGHESCLSFVSQYFGL